MMDFSVRPGCLGGPRIEISPGNIEASKEFSFSIDEEAFFLVEVYLGGNLNTITYDRYGINRINIDLWKKITIKLYEESKFIKSLLDNNTCDYDAITSRQWYISNTQLIQEAGDIFIVLRNIASMFEQIYNRSIAFDKIFDYVFIFGV